MYLYLLMTVLVLSKQIEPIYKKDIKYIRDSESAISRNDNEWSTYTVRDGFIIRSSNQFDVKFVFELNNVHKICSMTIVPK